MKIDIQKKGAWSVATKPCVNGSGFMAWAKMGQIVGSDPIDEPGAHVWFDFGPTREAASAKVLQQIGLEAA